MYGTNAYGKITLLWYLNGKHWGGEGGEDGDGVERVDPFLKADAGIRQNK